NLSAAGSVMALGPDNALWITDGSIIVRASISGVGGSATAQIGSPAPGTQLPSTTVTFTWNSVAGADGYWLDVGTVLAQGNICASGPITATGFTCAGIPTTSSVSTIYVQLWTHSNGVWLTPQRYTYGPPSGISSSVFSIASFPTGLAIIVDGV